MNKEINAYYLEKLNCPNLKFHYFNDLKKGSLASWLDSCNADYLAFGCLSSTKIETYPLGLEQFPFLIQHKPYCGGDFYIFSKIKPQTVTDEYFYSKVNSFEPSLPEWGWINENQCSDSLTIDGKKSFSNNTGAEFSPTYTFPLRDLMRTVNDVIDVSVDLKIPLVFPGALLVMTVTSDGREIKWSSVPVSDYVQPGGQGRVFHSMRLSDIDFRHHRLMFTAFLWNPMKLPYVMDNFSVKVRSGNPVIYGLIRKVGQY
jgi:hypothetical protein